MINIHTSLPINLKEINLAQKYKLIETPEECSKVIEEYLSTEKIIGLDCEGVYLSKEGKLTLIQVSKNSFCAKIFLRKFFFLGK